MNKKSNTVFNENFNKYFSLGEKYFIDRNWDKSRENYLKALVFKPEDYTTYCQIALTFFNQQRYEGSIKYLEEAIKINPSFGLAYQLKGVALFNLREDDLGIENFRKAMSFGENNINLFSALLYRQLIGYDWKDYSSMLKKIVLPRQVEYWNQVVTPFSFLCMSDSAKQQLKCAQNFFNNEFPSLSVSNERNPPYFEHKKIRLAYISADFRPHAISFLMTGLWERHDRSKFEVIAISLEKKKPLSLRQKIKDKFKANSKQRIKAAFDKFIDAADMGSKEIAVLIRNLEVDIAVDLMGYTYRSRTEIFSYRLAPIQVNYLGYPGTMGTDVMDYIIADPYVIPDKYQAYYSEKVAYLPDCFQANDDKRKRPVSKPKRSEAGLPEAGFVFCCFNNTYKINPSCFDIWMRLLKAVPESVLWILAVNETAKSNLSKEAEKRKIPRERLIFADKVSYEQYLERFLLADLFLDTLPFNAGTTASDALWMGVPVLTCSGEAFASRMAGSLLHAIGLPELIANNLEDL